MSLISKLAEKRATKGRMSQSNMRLMKLRGDRFWRLLRFLDKRKGKEKRNEHRKNGAGGVV